MRSMVCSLSQSLRCARPADVDVSTLSISRAQAREEQAREAQDDEPRAYSRRARAAREEISWIDAVFMR